MEKLIAGAWGGGVHLRGGMAVTGPLHICGSTPEYALYTLRKKDQSQLCALGIFVPSSILRILDIHSLIKIMNIVKIKIECLSSVLLSSNFVSQ